MAFNIELPNGYLVEGIPDGTPKEEIKKRAIAAGWATEADFIGAPDMPPTEDTSWMEDTTDDNEPSYMPGGYQDQFKMPEGKGAADVGYFSGMPKRTQLEAPSATTVGGVAGGVLGSTLGPAGAMLGSAAGSGLGELYSRSEPGKEFTEEDYFAAVKEAGISLGLDIATLGAWKLAAPSVKSAIYSFMQAGKSPQEAAKEIAELGSDEAVRRTQDFLSERGATLTTSQFPNATEAQKISEAIGRAGFFSGRKFDQNFEAVNKAVNDEFNKLFDFSKVGSDADIGGAMLQVIETGKKQLGMTYRQGMDEVRNKLVATTLSGKPVANRLKAYLKQFEDTRSVEKMVDGKKQVVSEKGYSISPESVNLIKETISDLDRVVEMKGSSLLDIQKQIMNKIDEMGDFNSGVYNSTAARELADFSTALREATQGQLTKVAPQAASQLKQVNNIYSDGMKNLLPPINERFVKTANKDAYEGLGRVLIKSGKTTNAKALLNSIRTSYAKVLHEVPKGSQEYLKLPYKTANEAVDAVRASYVKELMPTVGDEVLDIGTYATLAKKYQNKTLQENAKEVLGDKFVPFMDLLNTMAQASKVPDGAIPSLFLRAKEYSTLQGGAAQAPLLGKVATAGSIFGIPELLARGATNPKHVNKIKAFSKRKFKSTEDMLKAWTIIANDIVEDDTTHATMGFIQRY
jgi:hypothetical protein